MAHKEQKEYCIKIKNQFLNYFQNKKVLDCGSLDINGNNRYLFDNCEYIGIDVGYGKNVDIVSSIHEYNGMDNEYDFIISTECFEHDMHYRDSLHNIVRMLKPGGMFLFTCATTGRPEHGTKRTSPRDAPLLEGEWSDYYKNLTEQDIREVLNIEEIFSEFKFEIHQGHKDLMFYGIKK
jgi:SAM-dependent methyltransferase